MAENTVSSLPEIVKAYYEKQLLEAVRPQLVHAQFAMLGTDQDGNVALPQNVGDTVYFSRLGSLNPVTTPLASETDDPTPQALSVAQVSAQVKEYGGLVTASRKLELTSFTSIPDALMMAVADQAVRSIDSIIANTINAGTQVLYAGGKTARTQLSYQDPLTPALVKRAVRLLERNNTPKINGSYVGIIHPDAKYDLTNQSDWTDVSKYSAPEKMFYNEIGSLYGVRFVESSNAKVFTASGSSGGVSASAPPEAVADVYSTLIFGAGFYGIVTLDALRFRAGEDPSNLLGRRSYAGWYILFASLILRDAFGVRIESGVTRFGEDL